MSCTASYQNPFPWHNETIVRTAGRPTPSP
jgi:hypothetical protein